MFQKKVCELFGLLLLAFTPLQADCVKPNGCKGPSLCTSYPIIEGSGGYVEAGLLVQQMRVSNTDMAYAIKYGPTLSTEANPYRSVDMLRPQFSVDAGLRVSSGYYFDGDDWVLKGAFEWLWSRGVLGFKGTSSEIGIVSPTHIPEVFYTTTESTEFLELDATLEVQYFLLDIFLAKGSYFSGHFTFEPFAGVKSCWIFYHSRERYLNDGALHVPSNTSWLRTADTSFWGTGPMIGLNGNYYINQHWSLFSMGDFSVLLGESKITNSTGFVITQTTPTNFRVNDTNAILCPTTRAVIGLQYETDAYCETQHFTIKAGFDGRYYFNQYPVVDRPASSLLSTSGEELSYGGEIIEGGSFGMIGFILMVGWDF
jgi:hypothetical protein